MRGIRSEMFEYVEPEVEPEEEVIVVCPDCSYVMTPIPLYGRFYCENCQIHI